MGKGRGVKIEVNAKEILERAASKFGTGAHVIVPKEYAGKKLKIILEIQDE
jgi:putative transposon-encoded protein